MWHQFFIGSNLEKTNCLAIFSFEWKLQFCCMDASMSIWHQGLDVLGLATHFLDHFFCLLCLRQFMVLGTENWAVLKLAGCYYSHDSSWIYLKFSLEDSSCTCVLRYIFQTCSPQVLHAVITKLYPWFSIELTCFSFLSIFNAWLLLNSSHYLALFLTQREKRTVFSPVFQGFNLIFF